MGGFERFCAVDASFVTQKMADGLTSKLNLNDAQKSSLGDLRQTALTVAACGSQGDSGHANGAAKVVTTTNVWGSVATAVAASSLISTSTLTAS